MKHRRWFGFACATALLMGSIAVGCGSDPPSTTKTSTSSSSSSSSTTSSSSSGGGEGGMGGQGGGEACPTNEGLVLAVSELYFGEGNSGEWKAFGYDLDGKASTGNSKDLCMVNAGGDPQVSQPDGDNGNDNSFGKNLLPLVLQLYPSWVNDINLGIDKGNFTAIVKLMCAPESGDAKSFDTKLLSGTTLGKGPVFDGTDVWPIEPGLLNDPMDPESASVIFKGSSITGETYDAGKDVRFIISVPVKTAMSSTSIKLTLYSARIKMTFDPGRKAATAGMIGGVLDTEEFIAELKKVGSLMNLCGNPLFDNLLKQVRQASDIMVDGTQDPTKPCNGISMGLGFDMGAAQIGMVGPANPVGNACQ